MIKTFVLAAVGSAMLAAAGPAFAATSANSPPEPYTAPDPVYTEHKVVSTVTMHQPKDTVSLTDNGPAANGGK